MNLIEAANYYLNNYAIVHHGRIVDVIASYSDYFVESAESDFVQLDSALASYHGLYRAIARITADSLIIDKSIRMTNVYDGMDIMVTSKTIPKLSYNIQTDVLALPCLNILDYTNKCSTASKKRVTRYLKDIMIKFISEHRVEIVHEMVHRNDVKANKVPVIPTAEYGTPEYYNNGTEFNAYFISIIYNVFLLLKKTHQLEAYIGLYKTNRAKIFPYLVNDVIDKVVTKRFLGNLNTRYRNKFLSRLYELVDKYCNGQISQDDIAKNSTNSKIMLDKYKGNGTEEKISETRDPRPIVRKKMQSNEPIKPITSSELLDMIISKSSQLKGINDD